MFILANIQYLKNTLNRSEIVFDRDGVSYFLFIIYINEGNGK